MKSTIGESSRLGEFVLGNYFRGQDLKGKSDRRDQNQQRVDSGSMAEGDGPKESREGDVVAEVDESDQAEAGQHDGAATEYAPARRAGLSGEFFDDRMGHGAGSDS